MRRAWEEFVHGGTAPSVKVRDIVAASWSRSQKFSIGSASHAAPMASEAETYRQRSTNSMLVKAAGPALDRSRRFLADSSSMMILADSTGLVIETAGDQRIVGAGRDNHLERGGRWREDDIGTNAIGTALAEARPVQIHEYEHFCEGVQGWTCAAGPVRHPADGSVLGIIDISGSAKSFNSQSLALAISIAQEVEAILGQAVKAEHEMLLRRFLSKRSVWLSEDMLVLDRYGLLVHATEYGGIAQEGHAYRNVLSALHAQPIDRWRDEVSRHMPNANVEFVHDNDDTLGAVIVFHSPERRREERRAVTTVRHVEKRLTIDTILGESPAMVQTRERALKLAESGLPVLIEGETGVGKELFARALHAAHRPADAPFVPVNCGGMARDLIASELFGYQKGAFTGADDKGQTGRIFGSDGGTLCLDEIGELPLDLQPYLLRVLEDGVVYPIGSQQGRRIDLRLVSVTNRSLVDETASGRFRSDLYYRIAAARLVIPPLRQRDADPALLAEHFARGISFRQGRPTPHLSADLLDRLVVLPWHGNVRELRNVLETMVAISVDGRIGLGDLPAEYSGADKPAAGSISVGGRLKQTEKATILDCLEACGGNCALAAKQLGIARSTLYVRMAEHGITRLSSSS